MPLVVIKTFNEDIKKLNRQKTYWLILSGLVLFTVTLITIFWNFLLGLHSNVIWWFIGISGIMIAVMWWWWTMSLINRIMMHQYQLIELLEEISTDIEYVKNEVSYLKPNS
jgi:hypothetical protein